MHAWPRSSWLSGLLALVLAFLLMAQPCLADTLVDRTLRSAQVLLRYQPEAVDGYNQLASAYLLKSRETGDFSYVAKAEAAVQQALQQQPEDELALKLQLVLFLTQHQFQAGLRLAKALQSRLPDDPQVTTALIDALVELGNYQAAIATTRKLLAHHPTAPVYARWSYLRSLQGDATGAIAAMERAIQMAHPQDREGLAWYQVHLGLEWLNRGDWQAAEQPIDRALDLLPAYPLALAAKAKVRSRIEDWQGAIHLYQQAEAQMPLPDTAIALRDLYLRLGDQNAAREQADLVEFLVKVGGDAFCKAYAQQLALFWAEQPDHRLEALTLIQAERQTRADIYTMDALAWCLFQLDRIQEARTAINQALRLHTLDARLYFHAGMIYRAGGDLDRGNQLLQKALEINPAFHPLQADIARHWVGMNSDI